MEGIEGMGFLEGAALEMTPIVTGARVERVRQLGPHLFVFTLFGRGETRLLVMSLKSRKSGFHLLFENVHREYLRVSPVTDIIRKHLEGGRIAGVKVDGDLVELSVRHGSEYGLALRAREGAVALREGDRVLFTARRQGGEVKLSFDGEGGAVSGRGPGAGPGSDPERGEVSPSAGYPMNEEASRSLVGLVNELLRRDMKKRIRKEAGRIERLLGKLETERAETLEKDAVRKKGELIKTRLQDLRKGARSAVLADAEGAQIEVDLDPALSPLENMNALFKRYRKLKNRERYIDANIRRQEEKRDALAEFDRALDARGLPDVRRSFTETLLLLDDERAGKEIREALASPGLSGFSRAGAAGRSGRGGLEGRTESGRSGKPAAGKGNKPFLRFTSRTGKVIYAGRDAGENETLSTRVARGNDLWFHALGGAGSHVILRYDKKREFHESDIADASLLALYFSRLRKQGEGEVVYTNCKNLRKPKNSKAGMVTYHHNKTRYVKIEERALRVVMGREPAGKEAPGR
jgi:predicted ribosome quality control (RQC) complex YloA/Tae2 family protein